MAWKLHGVAECYQQIISIWHSSSIYDGVIIISTVHTIIITGGAVCEQLCHAMRLHVKITMIILITAQPRSCFTCGGPSSLLQCVPIISDPLFAHTEQWFLIFISTNSTTNNTSKGSPLHVRGILVSSLMVVEKLPRFIIIPSDLWKTCVIYFWPDKEIVYWFWPSHKKRK